MRNAGSQGSPFHTVQSLQATKRRLQSRLAQLRCGRVAGPPHSWHETAGVRARSVVSAPAKEDLILLQRGQPMRSFDDITCESVRAMRIRTGMLSKSKC